MHKQRVPRPNDARPGGRPPWRASSAEGLGPLPLSTVADRLGTVGDGAPRDDPASGTPSAAVLIALFEEDGDTRILLTRRSDALRLHGGEVSFPGGRVDAGETLAQCALREAREEIGLAVSVRPICWLEPTTARVSPTLIFPYVVALEGRPVLSPNPREVARAFDVGFAQLVEDGVYHEELWPDADRGGEHSVSFFDVATETIWGATARLLTTMVRAVYVPAASPSD